MNYMTALEADNRNDDNHGQLKANIAELEEGEYKLMALAVEMQDLREEVNSKREIVSAYKANVEAFVSGTPVSKHMKKSFGVKQPKKDETAGKKLQRMNLCLNCGKSGHQWKECTEKKAVCGSCRRHHHTTMHKTVLEIIARREHRMPFNRSQKNNLEDQAANVLDIDYSDDAVMDMLEESTTV